MPHQDWVKKKSAADRFVYWVTEREAVRLHKEKGDPKPWTADPILQQYRFCNVRRMDDKVSRWLLENWYEPYRDHPSMLYAVALARFVNNPASLHQITAAVFGGRPGPDWELVKTRLRALRDGGATVFNGAYMVRGNTKKSPDKIGTVVDEYVGALVGVYEAAKADKCPFVRTDSMERTHENVAAVYGFGSFMAGQVVADLRWAVTGEWRDRNDWAPVGPGSARGLARLLYGDERNTMAAQYVSSSPRVDGRGAWLSDFQDHVLPLVGEIPAGLSGRMEAMDWQNCLCEFDKYERALWGEGRPKQLYEGTV